MLTATRRRSGLDNSRGRRRDRFDEHGAITRLTGSVEWLPTPGETETADKEGCASSSAMSLVSTCKFRRLSLQITDHSIG